MDSELKNTSEDAEMADCDDEKVVTMMDVLKEQEDFEEDANAVLGASDDKNCTYSKGYIKRQAIYACMTCCSDAKDDPTKRSGVCLACSLTCHENHELVELYTKRNFKCDCGNPKFNSHPCQFTPNKTDLNDENSYNQNFSGTYCVCQRPYPDPESTVDVEMIQCIICEDWLHATHLEATVPDNDQYSEMICKGCMEKNDFLHDYRNLAVNIDVDVVTNGIDDKMIYDDDAKQNTIDTHETSTSADVEMTGVKIKITSENDTSHPEEIIEKSNNDNNTIKVDDINKDGEYILNDSSNDTEKHIERNSNPVDSNEIKEVNIEKGIEEAFENANSEESETPEVTQDNIDKNTITSENTTVEKRNNSEPVEEQYNKNSEPATVVIQTENTTEPEKTETIEKMSEELEEERLMADPEPDETKIISKAKDELEDESSTLNSDLTLIVTDKNTTNNINTINDNDKDEGKNENDKQNVPDNTELVSEKIGEKLDECPTSDIVEDKTLSAEEQLGEKFDVTPNTNVENKPVLEENESNSTENTKSKQSVGDEECPNEEKGVNINDKVTEKRKLSTEENIGTDIKKPKLSETDKSCTRPRGVPKVHKGATFWPSTFRQKLCTCCECVSMYKDLSVLFLLDIDDTVTAYENLGKQKINGHPVSQYEKGLEALSSLDRIQQINALTEYNKMRDKLLDFLKSFKERREVVKEEDIKAFFAEMKPKREPDGVYFCR